MSGLKAWLARQRTAARILSRRSVFPPFQELKQIAVELGISLRPLEGEQDHNSEIIEAALQGRVLAAWRERRDSRLWMVAVISGVASVISAIAAWVAVALHH